MAILRIQIDLATVVCLKGALVHGGRLGAIILSRCKTGPLRSSRLTGLSGLLRLFTGSQETQTFQNVRWDMERVQFGLQELGTDWQALFFSFLDVFEHAEGELTLDLFRASWVQSGIKGDN